MFSLFGQKSKVRAHTLSSKFNILDLEMKIVHSIRSESQFILPYRLFIISYVQIYLGIQFSFLEAREQDIFRNTHLVVQTILL